MLHTGWRQALPAFYSLFSPDFLLTNVVFFVCFKHTKCPIEGALERLKGSKLEANDLFGVGMFYHLLTSSAEAVELGDPPNLALLRVVLSAFIMKESTRVRRTI